MQTKKPKGKEVREIIIKAFAIYDKDKRDLGADKLKNTDILSFAISERKGDVLRIKKASDRHMKVQGSKPFNHLVIPCTIHYSLPHSPKKVTKKK